MTEAQPTDALLAERAKTHGDYTVHAKCTQMLKGVLVLHFSSSLNDLTAAQHEALDMIFHKIGRIIAGNPNFRDHWADIAGYAKLVADRCPEYTCHALEHFNKRKRNDKG